MEYASGVIEPTIHHRLEGAVEGELRLVQGGRGCKYPIGKSLIRARVCADCLNRADDTSKAPLWLSSHRRLGLYHEKSNSDNVTVHSAWFCIKSVWASVAGSCTVASSGQCSGTMGLGRMARPAQCERALTYHY